MLKFTLVWRSATRYPFSSIDISIRSVRFTTRVWKQAVSKCVCDHEPIRTSKMSFLVALHARLFPRCRNSPLCCANSPTVRAPSPPLSLQQIGNRSLVSKVPILSVPPTATFLTVNSFVPTTHKPLTHSHTQNILCLPPSYRSRASPPLPGTGGIESSQILTEP